MADNQTCNSTVIERTLCFYSEPADGDSPVYVTAGPESIGVRNYAHHKVKVPIRDLRGLEQHFSLEKLSFAALPKAFDATNLIDFDDPAVINARYLLIAEKLLLDHVPGAREVVIFDTMIRQASDVKTANRQVKKIHVDQSKKSAYLRAQRHLDKTYYDAIVTGQGRFRIINVWKPIGGKVLDHPLVFADHRSISQADLVPVAQVYPNYIGETTVLKYGRDHEFWYWSEMDVDDVLLVQCFDSEEQQEGTASGTLHTQCLHGSFELSESGDEPMSRKSIELRCLVFG